MSRRALIVAQPRDPATAMPVTIRLGGGGLRPLYHGGQHYRAGVVGTPRYAAARGFGEGGWTGASVPTTGQILFKPAQRSLLDQLATYYWRGAAVAISAGPEDGAIVPELTGEIASAAVTQGALNLTISDLTFGLSKPLIVARFLGTGGIEGVAEAAGRVKRRNFGRVFDIEGRILDKANSIYEFGDPSYPCLAITSLRDKGREGPITLVGWQGSIAATLAALIATVAPSGGGVVAPSICCAKWWTTPAGPLCADIQGEIGTGYADSAPGIAARILSVATGPAIGNLAAAIALRPAPAGLHIADVNESVAQALDRLLLGVSLAWDQSPDGSIDLREIAFGVAVETIRSIDVSRGEQFPPQRSRRVGYQRNERQHNDGEISLAVDGAKLLRIITNRVTIYCNADGTPKAGQNVAMRADLQNSTAAITWQLKDEAGADRTAYLTIVDDEAFLTPADFDAARGAGLSVTVFVSAADGGVVVSDELTIGRILDGQDAAAGVNQIINSEFVAGLKGHSAGSDGDSGLPVQRGLNLPGWYGILNVAYATLVGTPAAGKLFDGYRTIASSDPAQLRRWAMVVSPGDLLYFAMTMASHRCTARAIVAYLDADGDAVPFGDMAGNSLPDTQSVGDDFAGGDPERAQVSGGFTTVPEGARYAFVYPQALTSDEPNPYIFWSREFLARVAPDQVVPPIYNTGPADRAADVTGENTALNTLYVGSTLAADLLSTVDNILADGVLSRAEKPNFLIQWEGLYNNWLALGAKALALGEAAAERAAADAAVGALYSYLMGLSPAYNNTGVDTPISWATSHSLFSSALLAVANLQAAIQGLPGPKGDEGDKGDKGDPGVSPSPTYPAMSFGGTAPVTVLYNTQVSLNPGQTVNLRLALLTSSATAAGTIAVQCQKSPAGAGAWLPMSGGSGSSPFAVGEPVGIDVTGTYTNDTGANLVLELRGVITKTGAGVPTIAQANSFLRAS